MIEFNLLGKKYTINRTDIESIYLFGSFARCENDLQSDIDILFIVKDSNTAKCKMNIANELGFSVDWISVYSLDNIRYMATQGSYFLWHLKLEGIKLFSKSDTIEQLLLELNDYNRVEDDLIEYKVISKDIAQAILIDSLTLDYELSVIASLVRNTCIAICFMNNNYLFGRISPVKYCIKHLDNLELFDLSEYIELYQYRLDYIRSNGLQSTEVNKYELVEYWLGKLDILLEYAIIKLKGDDYDE